MIAKDAAEVPFNPADPYHCFAAAVENDANLRNQLVNRNCEAVQMRMANGRIEVKVITAYQVDMPVANFANNAKQQQQAAAPAVLLPRLQM